MRVGLRLGIDGSADAAVAASSAHGGGIEQLFLAFDLHHRVEGLGHDGTQFFNGCEGKRRGSRGVIGNGDGKRK